VRFRTRWPTPTGGALDDLRATDAEVVEARVVDAGNVVTAGGVTAGIDLALYLVKREAGADVADRVARELEYELTGSVHGARSRSRGPGAALVRRGRG
jgi:transcriptional regulator GlxA family with amidase domain